MKQNLGFTIIELVVVLAVTAILIFAIGGFYGNIHEAQNVEQTRQEIVQALRIARQRAIGQKNNSAHGVNFTLNSFTIYQGDTYAGRDADYDEFTELEGSHEISGLSGINFIAGSGMPNPAGSSTVTISGDAETTTVTITSTGVIY